MPEIPESDDEIEHKSWWARFKNSLSEIKNTLRDKIDGVTKSPAFQAFKNSPIIKTISDVVTAATAASPVVSIAIYSAMIAGVFLPVTAPIALAVGVIGLAGVAIGSVMDTLHTRSLRKAQKENNLLVNYRKAKNDQDFIISRDPELSKILNSKQEYIDNQSKPEFTKSSPGFIKTKAIGKALLRYASDVIVGVAQGIATSCLSLIRQVATTALFITLEGTERMRSDAAIYACNEQIAKEKNKDDAPKYHNVRDLMVAERKQRTQTMALRRLIEDPDYKDMTLENKKNKFETYKNQIEEKMEKIAESPKYFLGKVWYHVKSIVKDALRSQDPFSEFKDVSKLNILKLEDPPKIPTIDKSLIHEAQRLVHSNKIQNLITTSSTKIIPPRKLEDNNKTRG